MAVENSPLRLSIKDRRCEGVSISDQIVEEFPGYNVKINHPVSDDLFESVNVIQAIRESDNSINKSIVYTVDGKSRKLFVNGVEVASSKDGLEVLYTDAERDMAVVAFGEEKKQKLISLIQGEKVESAGFGYDSKVVESGKSIFLFQHKKVKGKTNTMFKDILDSAGNWKFVVGRNLEVDHVEVMEHDRVLWRGHGSNNYYDSVLYDGEKYVCGDGNVSGPYLDSEKKHYMAFVETKGWGLTLKKPARGHHRYKDVIYDGSRIATVIDATGSYVAKDLKYVVLPQYNKKSRQHGLTLVEPDGNVTKFGPYSSVSSKPRRDYRMEFDVTENKIKRTLEFDVVEGNIEVQEQAAVSA